MSNIKINGDGNFIISAPHTIKVDRLGENHIPEINVKKILNRLEKQIGEKYITTITWKTKSFRKSKKKHIDPNYYPTHKLAKNPWYKFLENKVETAKKEGKRDRLFLVDIHGMTNEKDYDIIIGFQALKKYMPLEKSGPIITNLLEVMEKFCHRYNFRVGYNIIFRGFINEKYYTVSQQSNSLGIPAMQIELSKGIRNRLVKNKIFFINFAKTLLNLYKLNLKTQEELKKSRNNKLENVSIRKNVRANNIRLKDYDSQNINLKNNRSQNVRN